MCDRGIYIYEDLEGGIGREKWYNHIIISKLKDTTKTEIVVLLLEKSQPIQMVSYKVK